MLSLVLLILCLVILQSLVLFLLVKMQMVKPEISFMMIPLGISLCLVSSGISILERSDFMNFCDLIFDWFAVTLFLIPFCLSCRALFYIGSWFKRELNEK